MLGENRAGKAGESEASETGEAGKAGESEASETGKTSETDKSGGNLNSSSYAYAVAMPCLYCGLDWQPRMICHCY